MSAPEPLPRASVPVGCSDEAALLAEAKQIFIELNPMGLAQRDEAMERACGGNAALRAMVLMLLTGAGAPLPFETLAEDIRSAQEAAGIGGGMVVSGPNAKADGGDQIGNYRLLTRIGEGGFGIVYMAEQERPVRRRVALKIIKLGMDTRQVVARFEAERQALALMDHPGIARVFDAGATQTGRPYFVMELVRGSPITDYCDNHTLPIRQRLELISQVCDALQHAHQKGVIHRDIKPSNVLVSAGDGGERPVPKIIDFGVAKATVARLTERTVFTEFRQMIGTLEYMSPEQTGESSDDVDTRTDVYSAGVLLYELLTGSTPFDSQRLRSAAFGEMQRIIREEDPPRPSTKLTRRTVSLDAVAGARAVTPTKLCRVVRGELDWIVMKALEKDRSRRYDSACSMAADIRRYLGGEAVHAAPPGGAYLVRKFVRRNRGPVIAASLLATACLAGLIGTSAGFFNADRQRKVAVGERRRADASAAKARVAERLATRRAYSASMMAASTSMNAVQYAAARASLEAAPESLRGWEWRVMFARLDSSIRMLETSTLGLDVWNDAGRSGLWLASDDTSLLTAEGDTSSAEVRQWDAQTGRIVREFSGSVDASALAGRLMGVSVSVDGNVFSTASVIGEAVQRTTIQTFDLPSGKRSRVIDVALRASASRGLRVSADGSRVFAADQSRLWLQGTATGELIAERELSTECTTFALSPDGTRWAHADVRNVVHILDANSLEPICELPRHDGLVTDITLSGNNRWLGSAADDDTARVWDLAAVGSAPIVLKHDCRVNTIRFSPDASLVATFARDRALRVWERATGRLLGTYASEWPLISSPVFLHDGRTIAAREAGGALRFWDVTSDDTVVLRGHVGTVSQARFVPGNPAGILISCGWDGLHGGPGLVRIWDAASGDLVGVHPGRTGDYALSLAVSRDGKLAAVSISNPVEFRKQFSGNGSARSEPASSRTEVIDLTTGGTVYSVPSFGDWGWVTFAADDRSVIRYDTRSSGGALGVTSLYLLDARTGAVVRSRTLGPGREWVGSPDPSGRTLAVLPRSQDPVAAGGSTISMLILDAQTLETIREVKGVSDGQLALGFGPDGSRFATCGADGALRVYNTDTGERIAALPGHGMEVLAVAFSPDGTRIASSGLDRMVRVWDATTFDELAAFSGHTGHVGSLDWDRSPAASGDDRLVSCSGDGTIHVWEPIPVRTRVEAREARARALALVTPMVEQLIESLKRPSDVAERIGSDTSLTPLARQTALQEVLRLSMARSRVEPGSTTSRLP